VVIAASAAVTLAAFARDYRTAYAFAGPSIFRETDRRQMAEVQAAVPEGEVILLVARPEDHWHARLWQRGLYPRNPVTVFLGDYSDEAVRPIRERNAIRWVVLIGPPVTEPRLVQRRELGTLPGLPARVAFGELLP
jgi:hypothetical protein